MKTTSSKLFRDDVKAIFRSYKGQMVGIMILSGFLIFLLNILIGISFYGNALNDSLRDKLGMYFYIRDVPGQEVQIYKQVMDLREKLQSQGLQVDFSTKEDALNFLQQRLPELTGSFERFGMKNPLPATLYVTFHDQSQYEILQRVMNENKEIILNIQDLSQVNNIQQQENRMVNIISLSNFVQIVCLSLVVVLAIVILSFSVFFLRGIFATFRSDMQVKKLLGAKKSQIVQPFITIILYAIIGGFLISTGLVIATLYVFDYHMLQVFDFALIPMLQTEWTTVLTVIVGELIVIIGPLMIISYNYVTHLHKKLR